MNELQSYFVQYIKEYISILTKDKEEFFISLCDIEEDLLEQMDVSDLKDYEVVMIGKRNYAEAICLRNNIEVKKIVLLSGDGVKHIDSLKDFNEYSVLNENRSIIWECLEKVFDIGLEKEVRGFLEAIIDQGEISLWELLQYIGESIEKDRITPRKLNQNLPKLEIWKSNEKKFLTKRKIGRLIRLSKYAVIEKRLTKAVTEGKVRKPAWERIITNSLAQGSVQKILENIYFEDAQEWLKYSIRTRADDRAEEINVVSESWHGFSYEYIIKEHAQKEITEIETEWLTHKNEEDADVDLDWGYYGTLEENADLYESQKKGILEELEKIILILPASEKEELKSKVENFWGSFEDAWNDIIKITPMCLDKFCRRAEEYTTKYMELLSTILTHQRIRGAVSGMCLVERLQTIFCEINSDRIRMPYYHPICVFYYMCVRKLYAEAVNKSQFYEGDVGVIQESIQAELIQKIGMQFPINIISLSEKEKLRYALDHTTVWQSGAVEFINIDEGLAYSVLDFKVVQKQIIDYIYKHPFLSAITVALIDISDLQGIEQLAKRIDQLSGEDDCNIGRIDFLILAAKEEELKKRLSQIWETFEFKEMIRFRFGKNSYSEGNGYDLKRIVEEADLTIIADSSILYQEPRRERVRSGGSAILNRLEKLNLKEQIQNYFENGYSDISVMWASLQQAAESRDAGMWKWKSREIDNKTLAFCNQIVEEYADKEVIALSSNKSILSEIFMSENMHAYCRKYNGKTITMISLAGYNREERLSKSGEAQISYSLNGFYETALDLQEVSKKLFASISDIQLDFYYKEKEMHCSCSIKNEEIEEAREVDSNWQEKCSKLLQWQIGDFLREDNIFSDYCGELLLNQWYDQADSLPAVLMVERLRKGGTIQLHFDSKQGGQEKKQDKGMDSLEAINIHEMIRFVMNKEAIDENSISYFLTRYGKELLDKVLSCDKEYSLLGEEERSRLMKIYERTKEN